jgi:hypothetical protein
MKNCPLSLSETSSGWRLTENRAMLSCNERSIQAHWLGGVDLCRSRAALEAEICGIMAPGSPAWR